MLSIYKVYIAYNIHSLYNLLSYLLYDIYLIDSTFDIYKLDYYRSVTSRLKNIIKHFFTIKFITLLTFYIASKLLNSFDLSKLL